MWMEYRYYIQYTNSGNIRRMRTKAKIFFLIHLLLAASTGQGSCKEHPDTYLSTEELIKKYGYPVEVYEVTTEDGYILTMYRIPHGRKGKGVNRKPALLMHGLFGQSENFIVNGINNGSLAYLMADTNYDVWLGNSRGTQHGRRHKELNPDKKEFWNFSWHEIGLYDVPAKIDFILEKTKKKMLHYVGHSQGGTAFYVMSLLRPEYQNKIALATLLAPGGFMKHFHNDLIMPFVAMQKDLTIMADMANIFEIPLKSMPIQDLVLSMCKNTIIRFRDLCVVFYHLALGGDSGQFNGARHFRPWDYGVPKNMEVYGKPLPDDYPVRNIKVPIAFYYSYGDNFANFKDVEDMCDQVGNCVRKFIMPLKGWTHLDFLAAVNAREELYEPLLQFAEKYDTE